MAAASTRSSVAGRGAGRPASWDRRAHDDERPPTESELTEPVPPATGERRAPPGDASGAELQQRAAAIHGDLPVVDGHNDLPWAIHVRADGDLDRADPRRHLEGYHTDIPRLLRGGVGGQFWSVYVPARTPSPLVATRRQIRLVHEMIRRDPHHLALASTADDAERIRASGRIASFLGAEGGHSIEGSLAAVSELYDAGVRYMTLTHADTTDWADAATDEPRHGGLTEFGRAVVAEMNRVGMLVDISHVSSDTMRQAIEESRAPVVASHSNAQALAPHPRNLPDDILQMIGATGGLVMVNFYPAFLVASAAITALEMFDEERSLMAELGDERAVDEELRRRRRVLERGTVGDVADHIIYLTSTMGVDHVGIGSDFDGVEVLPAGLDDASCYPALTIELLRRGWDERGVRKVLGENALRVLRAAEQTAVTA